MEESPYPRLPPPLKYINSPWLSVLPKYVTEILNAIWYAMFSQEPLRYERVALAYHGFHIVDFFSPDDGFRVRQIQRTGSKDQLVAKRVSAGFQSEVHILRILSDKSMENHRNHTAIPSLIMWGQRMHVTPLYHQLLMVSFTPNGVLNIAHQLIEVEQAVAFLHEHRIAHLDISPRNFLLARNPKLPKLRLLLTDMEFAVQLAPGVEPIVDLWHDCLPPPEGKTSINAFAYDMLGLYSGTYIPRRSMAKFF
ncbi:hypothetical protein FRC00_001481 [Tulasnella sp. 408]|nr:hypothetical protein FRC00_001481 [Tulasnella sp. 408]